MCPGNFLLLLVEKKEERRDVLEGTFDFTARSMLFSSLQAVVRLSGECWERVVHVGVCRRSMGDGDGREG